MPVMACNCSHEGQDKLHGKGQRVFNVTKQGKPPAERGHRCTACGKEK